MARIRNPFADARSTTVGVIGLTAMWAAFQVFDDSPPPILDQILAAAFTVWFATEARRNLRSGDKDDDKDGE